MQSISANRDSRREVSQSLEKCKSNLSLKSMAVYSDHWNLESGKSYYFTRNNSTLVAFIVGAKAQDGPSLFKILGCHTDSPVLKLAPVSKLTRSGFNQLGVQLYGGGLWHTWFDRDLTLAGKIIL